MDKRIQISMIVLITGTHNLKNQGIPVNLCLTRIPVKWHFAQFLGFLQEKEISNKR